jgi:hypothetical protein
VKINKRTVNEMDARKIVPTIRTATAIRRIATSVTRHKA